MEAQAVNIREVAREAEAWGVAEEIVSLSSLSQASRAFTRYCKDHPVTMFAEYPVMDIEKARFVESPLKPPNIGLTSRNEIGNALCHLARYYFVDQGWVRLKRCQLCKTWFVDTTKNKSTARCSTSCTNRWWDRNRRRQEGHKQQMIKKGAKRGTKKR